MQTKPIAAGLLAAAAIVLALAACETSEISTGNSGLPGTGGTSVLADFYGSWESAQGDSITITATEISYTKGMLPGTYELVLANVAMNANELNRAEFPDGFTFGSDGGMPKTLYMSKDKARIMEVESGSYVIYTKTSRIIITAQPASKDFIVGSISGSLNVAASAPGGAAPSYQWYSNTANSNTGGTAIAGATSASFVIPSALAVGTYYYFCEVGASGAAPVRSNAARVRVTASAVVGVEMVWIPGGSFQLGKEIGNASSYGDTTPISTVTLTGFYMGKYEVTQGQYQAVMGGNPSYFSSDPASGETQSKRPVENVSWYDALVFCNKLSTMEGLTPAYQINGSTDPAAWGEPPYFNSSYEVVGDVAKWDSVSIVAGSTGYRLPTEAQWEYAAKGGASPGGSYTYAGSNDPGAVAWYSSNSGSKTHEVGKKAANGLGLHDMSGNVWEWCWDWYGDYTSTAKTDPMGASSGPDRVLRGGSWLSLAFRARSVYRIYYGPDFWDGGIGFRLVSP